MKREPGKHDMKEQKKLKGYYMTQMQTVGDHEIDEISSFI